MNRRFVMGDIHGAYRALRQCLERSQFNYEQDHLICLGDVCDGWPETKQCIAELLKIKRLTYILGNHDWWMQQWIDNGYVEPIWFEQGGESTINAYKKGGIPSTHITFLQMAHDYVVMDNKLFVHAGVDPTQPLLTQTQQTFLWDRTLAHKAIDFYERGVSKPLTDFEEVFIGHTPTQYGRPIQSCGIWLMDTGAGWSGVLSMLNLDTKEIICSDAVPALYPGVKGRARH